MGYLDFRTLTNSRSHLCTQLLSCFLVGVLSAPLQWEEIRPVGDGPAARYGHSMTLFDTSQDSIFLFGGRTIQSVYADTWNLDTTKQGWSKVSFPKVGGYEGACNTVSVNERFPVGRWGHAMASSGTIAIMCGGQDENKYFLNSTRGRIECWWFLPGPVPIWTLVKLKSSSGDPTPRRDTTIVFDDVERRFVMYGGTESNFAFLGDCWYLSLPDSNLTVGDLRNIEFEWRQCGPPANGTTIPTARACHSAAFFSAQRAIFVFGGFEQVPGEAAFFATSDMWRLDSYHLESAWTQVMSTSVVPEGRAYHAMWISGIKLWVHGGEGYGGAGSGSTLADTWGFDVYTSVWEQYGTSDAVPIASRMSVLPASSSGAYCFGGLDAAGLAIGKLFLFTEAEGWRRVKPAGPGPEQRIGHVAAYDEATDSMVVFGGSAQDGEPRADLWVYSTATNMWDCEQGPAADGCRTAAATQPFGPGPRMLHAGAASGILMFILGGVSSRPCAPLNREGAVRPILVPQLTDDMWAVETSTYNWWKVDTGGPMPMPRMMHHLSFSRSPAGVGSSLMLFGGATVDCSERIGRPCILPQPMNDAYSIDTRPLPTPHANPDTVNRMASFDGRDDILQITLPTWCSVVESLSVLWIEAWLYPSAIGKDKTVLFNLYSSETAVLRWWYESVKGRLYIKLHLFPDGDSRLVKTWGPLPEKVLGFWHHVTFTLRFARVFQESSNSPGAAIAQAFCFVDAVLQPESGAAFEEISIEEDLVVNSGFSHLFVAGPNPSVQTSGFSFFRGSIDNIRVWWPSCPGKTDPSRCNPYGFLHPKLADGTRVPASGVHDSEVTMQMVAKPVWDSMFAEELPWDAESGGPGEGCLLFLDFNQVQQGGVVVDKSAWSSPDRCDAAELTSAYCDGCEPLCTFGHCGTFDLQCVSRGVDEEALLREYGEEGTCACLSVDDCPEEVEECICPAGTHRVCTECAYQYIDSNGFECTAAANSACVEIHPAACPRRIWNFENDEYDYPCTKYECACYDFQTGEGMYIDDGAAPDTGENYCASCPAGKTLTESYQPLSDAEVADFQLGLGLNVTHQFKCCDLPAVRARCLVPGGYYWPNGGGYRYQCEEWQVTEVIDVPGFFQGVADIPGLNNDCGIQRCCIEAPQSNTGDDGQHDDPECTSFFAGDQLVITCKANELLDGEWAASFQNGDLLLSRIGGAVQDTLSLRSRSPKVTPKPDLRAVLQHISPTLHPRGASQSRRAPASKMLAALRAQAIADSKDVQATAASTQWTLRQAEPSFDPLEADSHGILAFSGWTTYIAWSFDWSGPGDLPRATYHDMLTVSEAQQQSWVDALCASLGSELWCNEVEWAVVTRPAQDFQSYAAWESGTSNPSWGAGRYKTVMRVTPLTVRFFVESAFALESLNPKLSALSLGTATSIEHDGSYCGNGEVEDGEVCDDGPNRNNLLSPCGYDCACGFGWEVNQTSGECECVDVVDFTVSVRESTSEQGADNTIEVAIFLWDTTYVSMEPMITISALTGSGTADSTEFPLACSWMNGNRVQDSSWLRYRQVCPHLGLPPLCDVCDVDNVDEVNPYRKSIGEWHQASGTLKVLWLDMPTDDPCGTGKACDPVADFNSAHIRIRFTIQNPLTGQTAIHPTVKICGRSPMSPPTDATSTPVLGARQVSGMPGQREIDVHHFGTRVAFVLLPEPLQHGAQFSMHAGEALVDRAIDQRHFQRLPAGASFTGLHDSVLDVSYNKALTSEAVIGMAVDTEKNSGSGGCMVTEDKTLKICVKGWPALYSYESESSLWLPLHNVSKDNSLLAQVQANVSNFSKFAVVSTVPCCNYEGAGKACGDKICVTGQPGGILAVLGAGTGSKTPAIEESTRPILSSLADLKQSQDTTQGASTYRTRSPWKALYPNSFYGCESKRSWDAPVRDWIPARFAHAMTGISATRAIIYGGLGCNKYSDEDPCARVCVELVVLSDCWEWDSIRYNAGLMPFVRHELSPALDGLASAIAIPLQGLDSEIVVLGGSSSGGLIDLIQGNPVEANGNEFFEYRRLRFREGKVENVTMSKFSSFISHTAVYNDTTVVIFGGFVRNRASSAILVFDLDATSPAIALDRALASANGPASRAFPALIKPDAQTLIMYGGVGSQNEGAIADDDVTHPATNELWHLDLSTSKWTQVHDEDIPTGPQRVSFFASASWEFGGENFVVTHGGVLGGYLTTPSNTAGEFMTTGYVWSSSQLGTADQEKWYAFRSKTDYPGATCCEPNVELPVSCGSRPVLGCTPETARAMHAGITGTFVAGSTSMIFYGGYAEGGLVSKNMWYYDAEESNMEFSYDVRLVLRGVNIQSGQNESVTSLVESMISNGLNATGFGGSSYSMDCPSMVESGTYGFMKTNYPLGPVDGVDRLMVSFASDETAFRHCLLGPLFYDESYPGRPDLVYARYARSYFGNTSLENSSLEWSDQEESLDLCAREMCDLFYEVNLKEALLDFWQYSDREDCKTGCRRGVCQGATNNTRGAPMTDEDGDTVFCYREGDQCGALYECGLPLERAGHRLAKFVLRGTMTILLMFGGEKNDAVSDAVAELSSEVHAGVFSPTSVTFTKLWVSAADGSECDTLSCAASNCPCPRRDACIDVIRNSGSSNGKLIVFAGMAATGDLSPGWAYLNAERSDAVLALNDLWFLDLDGVTVGCLEKGECSAALPWTKVEVPGTQAPARWGAGMVRDTADNLYTTGGATVDENGLYQELGDFYVFQLLDPFFRKCSATGKGLTAAVAGTPADFFLQCKDALSGPADGARFKIDISGPVDMSPAVLPLGNGQYRCSYLPIKASAEYVMTIKVGRGGEQYQDLISGIDGDPTDSVHDYQGYDAELGVTNPNPFSLKVDPGSTNPATSLASGDLLSLTTAGVISSFTILALDTYLNRRPGGDSISVIMEAWNDETNALERLADTPKTAKVTDNSDGSYQAVYTITQGGIYRVSITFGGVYGASTPAFLAVNTAEADTERTYVYGSFLNIRSGTTSTLWVQTRDRYGNALRVHPSQHPAGSERISFELCQTVGSDVAVTCRGGAQDSSVGVGIDYSYGPGGKRTRDKTLENGGTPYWGLYRINYWPYNSGPGYTIEVVHNDVRVACFFNSAEDPGGAAADSCLAELQDMDDNVRRMQANSKPLLTVADREILIGTAFEPPDTSVQRRWLMFTPVLCAAVAVVIDVLLTLWRYREQAEEEELEREIAVAELEEELSRQTLPDTPVHQTAPAIDSSDQMRADVAHDKVLLEFDDAGGIRPLSSAGTLNSGGVVGSGTLVVREVERVESTAPLPLWDRGVSHGHAAATQGGAEEVGGAGVGVPAPGHVSMVQAESRVKSFMKSRPMNRLFGGDEKPIEFSARASPGDADAEFELQDRNVDGYADKDGAETPPRSEHEQEERGAAGRSALGREAADRREWLSAAMWAGTGAARASSQFDVPPSGQGDASLLAAALQARGPLSGEAAAELLRVMDVQLDTLQRTAQAIREMCYSGLPADAQREPSPGPIWRAAGPPPAEPPVTRSPHLADVAGGSEWAMPGPVTDPPTPPARGTSPHAASVAPELHGSAASSPADGASNRGAGRSPPRRVSASSDRGQELRPQPSQWAGMA